MKPVEIEFLVLDKTKDGAQRVSASVDRTMLKILGKMDKVQAKIDQLRSANNDAFDQDKNIAEIQKLEKQMDKLKSKMTQVSATSIGPSATEIDAVTQKYNGLNMSIQQIARELPVAAMGPQMFFMAISNNLPIFADELARARKEYEALVASGPKGVPVWKQILSSIVSWQTALTVGIMLLVTYGDEIAAWVTSLFKGKQAMDATAIATERFHATMVEGARNAQSEVVALNLLYRAATDTARSINERREAAEKLQESYPEYFSNLNTEQIMLGKANEQYAKLVKNIYDYAKAQAAFKNLVAVAESEQVLQGASSYEKYLKIYEKLKEARAVEAEAQKQYNETPWAQRGNASEVYRSLTDAQAWRRTYQREADAAAEVLIEELREIPGGSDVAEMINEQFNGEIGALIDALQAQRQSLEDVAAAVQLTDDPTKSKKQKIETDMLGRDHLLQAVRELEDAQNDIIEDGYAKRRAIAQTEFERQLSDIRKNREKLLAEDRKETGGANVGQINAIFEAQIMAVATSYHRTLAEINKEQQAATTKAYEDLLEKYETYQQKRARIAAEYDTEIAALATSPENQMEAEKAKEKALQELDIAFARQFPEFEAWANSIVSYSAERLRELIALAEMELDQMESNMDADPEAVAKLRARIAQLEAELAKALGRQPSDKGVGYDEWEDLSEVLGRVNDDLEEIGDTIGGVVGEIIKAAGSISTSVISIISGIKTLTDAATNEVRKTAEGAALAIMNLERASVILTIISAGLQVVQTIAGLLKQTETSQERNIRLAQEFNEELRIMNERARINKDEDSIFGDAVYQNFRNNIEVMRDALNRLEETNNRLVLGNWAFATEQMPPADAISKEIAKMQVQTQHSTWFRSSKYASLGDLIPELFGDDGQINMDALTKFADDSNETFQKLSEDNKALIKSLVGDWETYTDALDAVRDYLSSIFGELGDTILDTMISVADGTMTAADAMTTRLEALSDVVKNFAKQMIYAMTIGPILEQAQKDIEAIQTGTGTDEEKFDAMMAILGQVVADVSGEQSRVNSLYEQFKAMAAEKGFDFDSSSSSQTGKAGTMYTVSQDSFTRMEGIATSIQGHSASMDLKFDSIASQMSMHLNALNTIANNTSPIAQIYSLLVAIDRDGLNVK